MIAIGTLCLIVYAIKHAEQFLGRECVVVSHVPTDELGHHLKIMMNDGTEVLAADKCLLPISSPADVMAKHEREPISNVELRERAP